MMHRRHRTRSWSLTQEGRARVDTLVGELDLAGVHVELAAHPGAALGHATHAILPPVLAPAKWSAPIRQMLGEFSFESNVFCMTRFPESETDTEYLDPVRDLIALARDVLAGHGLTLHVADDRQLDEDLFGNIAAHMWACRFGIALFEDRRGRGLNHNMLIEVGAMLALGRRCALLKDAVTVHAMPTDFVGQIYKSIDLDELDGAAAVLHRFAADDLGFGRCRSCPS
jgi:hypothetical protein